MKMKSRTIIHFAISALLFFTFISCEKEASDGTTNSSGSGSSNNTISEQVKEITLNHTFNDYLDKIVFYESYTYRYSFCFNKGCIKIYAEERRGGSFGSPTQSICGIKDTGYYSSISEIPRTDNIIWGDGMSTGIPHYPKLGLNAIFLTEEMCPTQMRIYAKDYTLDNDSRLKTVTIQYQLVAPETFGDESVLNGTSWVATTPQFGYPANVDWRMVFTTANSGVLKIHYGWGGNDSSFPFSYAYSKDIGGKILVYVGSRPIWSFVLEDESLLLGVPGNNNVISVGGSDGGGVVTFHKQ